MDTIFNPDKQHTLKKEISFSGTGLHTGEQTHVRLIPKPADYGIKFCRLDIGQDAIIKADCDLVTDTQRGTTLTKGDIVIQTTEHLLAAIVGSGIDNILIEINSSEIPIMDGSSIYFSEQIKSAGIEELKEDKFWYSIDENLSYKNKNTNTEIIITPHNNYELTSLIDFNSPTLGTQHASLYNISEFDREIASCRTFCFLHEVQLLHSQNLIKGGDLNNAIVIVDKKISEEEITNLSKIFGQDKIEVKPGGYLNNVELRYPNEPARHKLLDVIGDLALIGYPIKGKIFASRPGHKANIEFAKIIKDYIQKNKHTKDIPTYDPNIKPILEYTDIEKLLPHRFPFLLVDKVLKMTDDQIVSMKNVSGDQFFFQGHFPNNPVLPGVLEVEALAQTGGILVLSKEKEPEFFDTYFLKINNCKFTRKILPGDTMLLRMKLTQPVRRGIVQMHGQVFVNGKISCEADLVAQVIDRRTFNK